jgi:uncharacterized protein YggE
MKTTALMVAAFTLISAPLYGQERDNIATIPSITVASRGEVKVAPDRASIQISVQTRAESAAQAATENARKQKAVIDALHGLGLGDRDISTSGYNVYPEQRYEPNKEPVIVGYNVTNTVTVDLKSIALVGKVIDASLANGANMINSLQFYASNVEAARREAIAIAIRKARADAEAAAKAAGGSVSGLLDVTIGGYYPPPPRPIEMKARGATAAMAPDTPISAGDETVAVDITTRWRYQM